MKKISSVLSAIAFVVAIVASYGIQANTLLVTAYGNDTLVDGSCNPGTLVESNCDTSFTTGDVQCKVSFTSGAPQANAYTSTDCLQEYWRTPI